MPKLSRLTETLWVTQSRLFATNSGIFFSQGHACLVDPGIYPDEIDEIENFLNTQALKPEAIIITHAHWDHILGPERFPGVPVITQQRYLEVVEDHQTDLHNQIATWENRADIQREKSFILPHPQITFQDSYELSVGDLSLHLIHIPGHTPDQCAITCPEDATLWAADMLSDLEIPLISASLGEYRETLRQLAQLEIKILIPGHGTPTTDRDEIDKRLLGDQSYVLALSERISQGLQAGETLEEIQARCADISYRKPEQNRGPHHLNVESAYLEFGGIGNPKKIGWDQEWDDAS